MSVMNPFSKNYFKAKSSLDALQVYPLEETGTTVIGSNFYRVGDKLHIDLQVSTENTRLTSIKIESLSQSDLDNLEKSGFPTNLTTETRESLFSSNENTYKITENLEDVQLELKNIPGQNFKFLVVIFDDIVELGEVQVLSISKASIIDKTNRQVQTTGFSDLPLPDNSSILEKIESQAYTSNLLYSFSSEGTMTGFYGVDAQKLIDENAAFPHLLNVEDNEEFSSFLFKTTATLLKYNKAEFGYSFEDVLTVEEIGFVPNLIVSNADTIKFYNFSTPNIDVYSDFQAVLKFFFNDISIIIANNKLQELQSAKINGDRVVVRQLTLELYNQNIPEEYQQDFSKIGLISDADFDELADKIIDELSEQIVGANNKTVSNQVIGSQYTTPYFSLSNPYQIYLEQKFEQKIKLNSDKPNTFYPLRDGAFFKTISIQNVDISIKKYINATIKSFTKVNQINSIESFNITSIKGVMGSENGLSNRVVCSDTEQKAEQKLQIQPPADSLDLTTTSERDIKLFYLESVGDSVSALSFKEADENLEVLLSQGQRVLARLDNYEEFYDSYFYIEGTSV